MKRINKTIVISLIAAFICAGTVSAASYITSMRVTPIRSIKISIDTESLTAGEILGDASSYISVPDNEYYSLDGAEWDDGNSYLTIGDTPKMTVYLSAIPKEVDYSSYTKIWLFSGSYSSSSVSVSGGSFVRAFVQDSGYVLEVTVQLKSVRGQYTAPEVYWDEQTGVARWNPTENDSGIYDVICHRDGHTVKKLEDYQGTYYNFYPYMTKEGDYTFKVRAKATSAMSQKGARSSEYAESGDLYIDSTQVSNGSGQESGNGTPWNGSSDAGNAAYPNGTGTQNVAGWVTDSKGARFRYPNGTYAGAGWLKLNGSWYFLGANGLRLSGWQKDASSGLWYYMDNSTGVMKTGWLHDGDKWYYLRPNEGGPQGSMATGWLSIDGKNYYLNASGVMVTGWYEIGGKWYYFWPQGSTSDGKYGFLATNTQIGDFYIGADGTWQN
ncbi:MAG: N-acetylmuramoyl-L-alanine amidase family protein [Lachnospiraceae bacterium]|nr:N-acetylmuramoyl-L-alanine amidase family protein [Lachnospiraceae bacterium]